MSHWLHVTAVFLAIGLLEILPAPLSAAEQLQGKGLFGFSLCLYHLDRSDGVFP
jgi:hypothetical protein